MDRRLMLYAGKRPTELSTEELNEAMTVAADGVQKAREHFATNEAALLELYDELCRRERVIN